MSWNISLSNANHHFVLNVSRFWYLLMGFFGLSHSLLESVVAIFVSLSLIFTRKIRPNSIVVSYFFQV